MSNESENNQGNLAGFNLSLADAKGDRDGGVRWNDHQNAIFEELENGDSDIVVEALAGTGKTTTMCEGIRRLVEAGETGILAVAFNTSISKELTRRFNEMGLDWKEANSKTLHGAGNRLVKEKFPKIELDQHRALNVARRLICEDRGWDTALFDVPPSRLKPDEKLKRQDVTDAAKLVKQVVSMAKSLLAPVDDIERLMDIAWNFGFTDPEILLEEEQAVLASRVLQHCIDDTTMYDFDDMVWLPYVHNLWPRFKHSFVFVDEAQDMNPAQLHLARKFVNKDWGGRLVAIGDSHQAIYGWRGADSGVLKRMARDPEVVRMTMPITYRCAHVVAAECQTWVPEFTSGSQYRGEVLSKHSDAWRDAQAGDFILSRTNAPLVGACLSFLRRGIPAAIQGREVGDQLANLVEKFGEEDVRGMLEKLAIWERKEIARCLDREDESAAELVRDKAESIRVVAEDYDTSELVAMKLREMFRNDTDDAAHLVALSTVHRAKGMERDEVWLMGDTFMFNGGEENNIRYVAVSRAKYVVHYCGRPLTVPAPSFRRDW